MDDRTPRILITAGPTHEPIDAVRHIANRSSGRMGIAIARAAAAHGGAVTLLLGPVSSAPPEAPGIDVRRFRTAADLEALLASTWPAHDVLVMAAAVADFRPRAALPGKLVRGADGLVLELEPVPDLLAALPRRPGQRIVAFALEPADRLAAAARAKLERKGADVIVANPLETMDAADVDATVIDRAGRARRPGRMPKEAFAAWLVDKVVLPAGARRTYPPPR